MIVEGEAVLDRSLALPRGVGGNNQFEVGNAFAYDGRGNVVDESLERDAGTAFALDNDWVAADGDSDG